MAGKQADTVFDALSRYLSYSFFCTRFFIVNDIRSRRYYLVT